MLTETTASRTLRPFARKESPLFELYVWFVFIRYQGTRELKSGLMQTLEETNSRVTEVGTQFHKFGINAEIAIFY